MPLAVVLKKAVRVFRRGLPERLNIGAVGKEDIQFPVVVIVEGGHVTNHRFGSMALGGLATTELKINRLVSEPNRALNRGFICSSCGLFLLSNARSAGEARYLRAQRYRYQYRGNRTREFPLVHGQTVALSVYNSSGNCCPPRTVTGYVSIFDSQGRLLSGLQHSFAMNSPWGVALAPSDFVEFSGSLLVGQSGSGAIMAYDIKTGALKGALLDESRLPIRVTRLWAIAFGNDAGSGPHNSLYFT